MAKGKPFPEATHVLGAPPGSEEDVYALHVRKLDGRVVSCWKLDPEELLEVLRTGEVWLSLWGHTMVPALVTGHKADVI